jgi:predicted ATPase with chaperone activity
MSASRQASNAARARGAYPQRRAPTPALATLGGLIVVGGPPLHGKSILAARLADVLPFSHKLEAVDNLSAASEYWDPSGLLARRNPRPLTHLLKAAADVWARTSPAPVIIIAARVATQAERQLARRAAESAGVKFLHVEALSHNIRAFARLSSLMLAKDELLERMRRYERAVERYVKVNVEEEKRLPAVRLRNVLADLDAATSTTLERWVRA